MLTKAEEKKLAAIERLEKKLSSDRQKLYFLSAKRVQEMIKKDNEKFRALSPAAKRVAIAQEVLAQMRSGFLEARNGSWGDYEIKNRPGLKENDELSALIADGTIERCDACALGGLFVSAVKIANKLTIKQAGGTVSESFYGNQGDMVANLSPDLDDLTKYLGKFFSQDQLRMIEIAFERGAGGYSASNGDVFTSREYDAQFFVSENDDSAKRMRKIMKNIIDNGGEFNPPVLTDKQRKEYGLNE